MQIRITSKKDGFRRADRVHTGTKTYSADAFTQAELAALKNDPMLVVDEWPDGAGTETSPDLAADLDETKTALAAAHKALSDAGERETALKERLDAAQAELADVRKKWDEAKAAWQAERDAARTEKSGKGK